MKGLDVEFAAELVVGPPSKFQNLQLTELIAQRLGGKRDVAIHFRLRAIAKVRVEVVHHLLARPLFVMHAGVDNQTDGAKQFATEAA